VADIHAVTVPKWGIEMQEGTITGWRVNENAEVEKGQELIDIETDKIVNTLEAPFSGVLRRRLVNEGDTLKVGALLGVIADAAAAEVAIDAFVAVFKPADASFAFDDVPVAAATPAIAEKVSVSPAAARRARELGVNFTRVTGTGRGGRISTEDVERFACEQGSGAAAVAGGDAYESIPLSTTRRTIARRLVEAKQQIPHFYLGIEVEMEAALDKRRQLEAAGTKISVNDLILHTVVQALRAMPDCNIHVVGEEVRRFRHVNLAFAVATDRGLMTPVIPRADTLSLADLARTARELATRARAGELTREQVEHGTFTVSNLGMQGITEFLAVINPPQGGILAVGAVRPVLVPDGAGTRITQMMKVMLSCDHRAIDGALGAAWLKQFKGILQTP
jgi:pyruvate dehydrogenase E2 component (dihydrolipoamide acetyltransferase)